MLVHYHPLKCLIIFFLVFPTQETVRIKIIEISFGLILGGAIGITRARPGNYKRHWEVLKITLVFFYRLNIKGRNKI